MLELKFHRFTCKSTCYKIVHFVGVVLCKALLQFAVQVNRILSVAAYALLKTNYTNCSNYMPTWCMWKFHNGTCPSKCSRISKASIQISVQHP